VTIDTVPYLPPLASYNLTRAVGEIRHGMPIIDPEDLVGDMHSTRLQDVDAVGRHGLSV